MNGPIVVTGGYGFIGSCFIRLAAANDKAVVNVDVETYAASRARLDAIDPRMVQSHAMDVCGEDFAELVNRTRPSLIAHFAAESHVTRSEAQPDLFFHSNVEGTRSVLEAAKRNETPLVIHISTDEVYGPCENEPFSEDEKLPAEGRATSAYARSKALADDLAMSYSDDVPVIVVRPTNCFGPWQDPEKAVARWSVRALSGERLPVWGDGGQVRDWMFVDDAAAGIAAIGDRGTPGEVYNLGPERSQVTNLEIAQLIASAAGSPPGTTYLTEYDRPQHDRRYAIATSKVRALGWNPATSLEEGIDQTVEWYRRNQDWWRPRLQHAEGLYDDRKEARRDG